MVEAPSPAAADLAACRRLLRDGSRSFYLASFLLPPAVAGRASALYAFCRLADDSVDDAAAGQGAVAVTRLRQRLDAVYAGQPGPGPVDRAFAALIRRHDIPRELPEALLEGMAWDAAGRDYETLSDVIAYAARVAATVGVMMSLLMERRAPMTLARACDLGVAMQLTNIARDVGEDARMGRLYLPRAWLREAGVDPAAFLAAPAWDPALLPVIRRLLDEADVLYARGAGGIALLPVGCRPGIHAARRIYAEIGHGLLAAGGDAVSRRTVVPRGRKIALAAAACLDVLRPGAVSDAPALPEVRFLIDAVAGPSAADGAGATAGDASGVA